MASLAFRCGLQGAVDDVAAEDKGDDAVGHVLVDAGEEVDLDNEAGLLAHLTAEASSMVSSRSRMPPGGSHRPLSRRWVYGAEALAVGG